MNVDMVPFEAAHFAVLRSWFADQTEAVLWGGPEVRWPVDESQLAKMVAQTVALKPVRRCWSATSHGEVIGHAQLAFDWRNGVARLGRVAIAPAFRGRGIASPMLRKVIGFGFDEAEIERMELNVYSHNQRAINLYLNHGFRLEGNRRSSARVGEDRWDTLIMGMLRSELPECDPS